ncbi:MAG: sigma-54-dependent Fis family transcriptional regulator [Rhodobacteraceae bacterium]|nr:sigma-54-dependent Fis family transcriptional regulator [Paracoccaceae bacterium]
MPQKTSTHASSHKKPDKRMLPGRVTLTEGKAGKQFPGIDDLVSKLRFSVKDGQIWFDTQRVTLIHLSTLTALRHELINSLGKNKARGFLTRMGWESGARDAHMARRTHAGSRFSDQFLVGLQLRRLQGVADTRVIDFEADLKSGHFFADFSWPESFEAKAHVSAYGVSDSPVCWLQIGYYCGYSSTLMGRTILFHEVECMASGGSRCRIVGKPLQEWGRESDEFDDAFSFLRPEPFVNQFDEHPPRTSFLQKAPERTGDLANLPSNLIGVSAGFTAACYLLKKVVPTGATVLFHGETGVGKEVFARTLHHISPRADRPFVAVDCAAISDDQFDSEMFGVADGAFGGATTMRPGRFERADGGTLFLDEVDSLSLASQLKLLRAVQDKEVERIGDTRVTKVDVRIISATSIDLHQAVANGSFRRDLLYRLHVFPIHLLPLRERRDDIPLLMDHFLARFAKQHGKKTPGFTSRAVEMLYTYDYPGNVRELENLIERAVILCDQDEPIDPGHLFTSDSQMQPVLMTLGKTGELAAELRESGSGHQDFDKAIDGFLEKGVSLKDVENHILERAVEQSEGNLAEAARRLGLTRPQLAYRLKKAQD